MPTVNIYAPNIGALQYTRHTLTDVKREIYSNTRRVENFKIPLTSIDNLDRKSVRKNKP